MLDIDNITKVEKVINNHVFDSELSNSFNKILTISNFFKEIYTLEIIDDVISNNDLFVDNSDKFVIEQPTAKVRRPRSLEQEKVHLPGVVKVDNNIIGVDEINTLTDTVLINVGGDIKSISFINLLEILTNINNKGKTIWDLGETADIDESSSGSNPSWS
ncbi:MAG: hypothetical protein ACRDD8_15095 [Bacteroidales bacterium]